MSEYITPGVYINEFDKLTWVAPGSSTITGVVGEAEKGPAQEIKEITSFEEFTKYYGSGSTYLSFFARFFFKLGGKILKVVRATEEYRYAGLEVGTKSSSDLNMDNSNPIWVAATSYVKGNVVTATTPDGTTQYRCTTAGISGIGEPTWDTVIGNSTIDNTVTWVAEAATSKTEYAISDEVIISSSSGITTYSSLLDEVPTVKASSLTVKWTGRTLGTDTLDSDFADPWAVGQNYVVDDVVTEVASTNDFQVTTAGSSGLVNQEPYWDTTPGNTTGGTPAGWAASTAYNLGETVQAVVTPDATVTFVCTTAGTSGAAEPTWDKTTPGTSTTADGTAVWTVDNRSTLEFTCIGAKAKETITVTETWAYAGKGPILILAAANPAVATQVAGSVSENLTASPPTFTIYIDDTISSDIIASTITSVSTIMDASVTSSITGTYWYSTASPAATCAGGATSVARSTTDTGAGVITPANELTAGTINYTTGAISLTFSHEPVVGTNIYASYTQQYSGIRSTDTEIKLLNHGTGNMTFANWPEAGIIKIEDEYIRYCGTTVVAATANTNEKVTLSHCTRGMYGTTAADHFINGTDVHFVCGLTYGQINAAGSGGNVPQGLSFITFKNLEGGILPETGSIRIPTSTSNVIDTISYTAVTYTNTAKTAGYLTLSSAWTLDPLEWDPIVVTSTYIPGDTGFVLAEDTIGGFSGKNYEKYQEYDGWGQATYSNGIQIDDGGVDDPEEEHIFFNILARYPGSYANDNIRVSVYTYSAWNDSNNIPYFFNKIDKFPESSDEVLIVVEDSTSSNIAEYFLTSLSPTALDEWGKVKFITDVVNERSDYIRIFMNSDYRSQTTYIPNSIERAYLTGGTNGTSGYVSDGNIILAYDLFLNKVDEPLDLLSASGYCSRPIQNNIIAICESRRDCFGILNIPYGFDPEDAVTFKKSLTATTYAGIYYNWFKYYDPVTNTPVYLPPAIQVTGLFVKNDYIGEAWTAPAGYERCALIEVESLESKLDDGDLDTLYMNSINPITNQEDGPVIWGIKTLYSAQSAFSKINIRRLLLKLEKDIGRSMKQFMFAGNTPEVRSRVKLTIDPYLDMVQGKEGILDKLVVCNDTNNPYSIQQLGQLIVDIYIQPVFAAEYIILNFTVTDDVVTSSVQG